jgi:Protein of unknown function (DUF2577)
MSGERLYSAFKTIAARATPAQDMTDLVYGLVKSLNPLKIEVENKYTINQDQISLSPLCYRKDIRVIVLPAAAEGDTSTAGAADVQVQLWRGLAVGDRVTMLRHSGGQAFYVLQRTGELT